MEAIDDLVFNPLNEFLLGNPLDPDQLLEYMLGFEQFPRLDMARGITATRAEDLLVGLAFESYVQMRLAEFAQGKEYFERIFLHGIYHTKDARVDFETDDQGVVTFKQKRNNQRQVIAQVDAIYQAEIDSKKRPVVFDAKYRRPREGDDKFTDPVFRTYGAKPYVCTIYSADPAVRLIVSGERTRKFGIPADLSQVVAKL